MGGKIIVIPVARNHKKECFMKNTIKFLGFIALIVIIGFSMAACNYEPKPVPMPETPVVRAVAGSGNTIHLFWTQCPNSSRIQIFQSLTEDGEFESISNPGYGSHLVTGLALNTKYYFKVVADNETGIAESSVVSATTTGVALGTGANGITLGGTYSVRNITGGEDVIQHIEITGLQANTTYIVSWEDFGSQPGNNTNTKISVTYNYPHFVSGITSNQFEFRALTSFGNILIVQKTERFDQSRYALRVTRKD